MKEIVHIWEEDRHLVRVLRLLCSIDRRDSLFRVLIFDRAPRAGVCS